MKVVVVTSPGGPDVLKEIEVPEPELKDDGVLIKVAATALNEPDLTARTRSLPPMQREYLGLECAGTIVKVGKDVQRWKVGQEVIFNSDIVCLEVCLLAEPQRKWCKKNSSSLDDQFNENIDRVYKQKKGERVIKMDSVRKVFDMMPDRDIVSWNTVIAGMYEQALARGKEIHVYAVRHGFDADVLIGSSLIDMYANSTHTDDSLKVFNLLRRRDSISWNLIIGGYVQNGMFDG
ncbi:hypothetical protein RchiOBHm_Chr5g0030401 [Rosa chinensis]|uniref:Alcohol dehydrogenase-like N-terminal domain-containing protein n=1 Tax=Rosa chinensis TaxID=74649 RepID=A0A2P6Q9Y0_ROSCH|nr:hypothetical protein RchiOBHm_Chr5g0030401 [Rosa chinensis]